MSSSSLLAMTASPPPTQFTPHHRPAGKRPRALSDLPPTCDSPLTSASPSVSGRMNSSTLSYSSSRSSVFKARRRCDSALRVMLKKHDCQFKLPQGELQTHLHAIFHHLRAQDTIKLAVRLESWDEDHRRYLVIISTIGRQDTEESIIVGCDFETRDNTTCTIGLVLPLWSGTNIRLDGDGGFHIKFRDQCMHTFKPVSVQAMWSALQSLNRCLDVARRNNYYEGSLYLTWTCFYTSKVSSERVYVNEWNYREDLAARTEFFAKPDPKRIPVEKMIRAKLKAVMMEMDLDSCTSRQIRLALESQVSMDLKEYKEYIDTEMLKVLGEMDCSSKILDHLYLGSEWNASNLEELEELGFTHILNVTMEIDNFFPNNFRYKSVRLYDDAESDLLPHWNHTWKFIEEARKMGGKCLVHCRMGISRSSATVCAYLMKSKLWSREKALKYVQSCRPIADPNPGFRRQLEEYEGILSASAHRHSKLFRSRSENNLSDTEEANGQSALGVLSPRVAPNLAWDREVTGGVEDFDLNRRLLDITNLISPRYPRAKSWSPEDGETHSHKYYKLSLGNQNSSDVVNRYFRNKNFSEPVEFLTAPSCDPNRNKKLREKRKNFFNKRAHLRRNTVSALILGGSKDDDLAHSDESVFVCDGYFPPRWRPDKRPSSKKNVASTEPTSTSAPKQPADPLTTAPTPSLVPQATSSELEKVKSCSVDPATPPNSTQHTPILDTSGGQGGIEIPIAIPVREIVAVIESPSDDVTKLARLASGSNLKSMGGGEFVKGHHKTASLPPAPHSIDSEKASPPTERRDGGAILPRDRSYSETQTALSVKKIVTAIESGNLHDNELPVENSVFETNFGDSSAKTSAPPRLAETIPPKCDAVTTSSTDFYVGDNEPPADDSAPHRSANSNNNHILASTPLSAPLDDASDRETVSSRKATPSKFFSPFPPTILRVIEKVGMQLMKNNVGNSATSSFSDDSKTSSGCSDHNSASKKRGVRQMVREIERSVRKLRKSSVKTAVKPTSEPRVFSTSAPAADESSSTFEVLPSTSPNIDTSFPVDSSFHSDVHVRTLVDKFDVSADEAPPTSSPVKKLSFGLSSLSPQQELISFTSPQPYRVPDRFSGTFKASKSLRRSQSDRSGRKSPIIKRPGNSRSFRAPRSNLYSMTRVNLRSTSKLHKDPMKTPDRSSGVTPLSKSSGHFDPDKTKSPVVRRMVTDIERKFTPSPTPSIHRSSSMPSSKCSKTSSKVQKLRERKSLRKAKSSPFLNSPWVDGQFLS